MGTVIRKSGAGTGGGGTPTTSEIKAWRYKNADYISSATALNLVSASKPISVMANVTNNFKTTSGEVVTTDFVNNEDAITLELDKVYSISVSMKLEVEVDSNTVELALVNATNGSTIQLANFDTNKNVDSGYSFNFPLIKGTSAMVSDGIEIVVTGVQTSGSVIDMHSVLISIQEIGTAV